MLPETKIRLLRVSFWTGAVVDAIAALLMISPGIWASFNGLDPESASPALIMALGPGVALMIGWTILLIWADRKPTERKGVLLITVFPVIAGMVIYNVYGLLSGLESASNVLPQLALQVGLVALFVFSYNNARGMGEKCARPGSPDLKM